MATERTVEVEWIGDFLSGEGTIQSSTSGQLPELMVSWPARTDEDSGLTSPEELLAAAHATCFAMQLTSGLVGGGREPEVLNVSCTIGFEVGVGIVSSKLVVRGEVPDIPDDKFRETAERAKLLCPVSKALAGIEINLELPDLAPPEEDEEPAEAEE